ncbi:MAG: class I SAM-dependent rRNA methyltransferase [Kiritimatiellia bacterium]
MVRAVLRKGRERSVSRHHPWIFSGALAEVAPEPSAPGETVEMVTAAGEPLGYGSYSPCSQIRVRMLSFDPGRVPDAAFIESLVAAAVARRAEFFAPASTTNAWRAVNAESDGLPGVVADCYGGWVVCQLTSAGAERWKDAIAAALMKSVPGCRGVAERTDAEVRKKEGLPVSGELRVLAGEAPPEFVELAEGPIRALVDVRKGHKTGFYLDQRDARAAVGALARGRTVLNCFCYTGGFGLAAVAGGAEHVTQVDVSREALELARRNAELTLAALDRPPSAAAALFAYAEEDVFRYLRQCRDARRTFGMIVLDPPKFAESKAQVTKAARGYKDINLLAMKLLAPGGILATFSCSGAMDGALFDRILAEAAQDAQRDFQVIARTRQGADHPVALNFPEGLYLKGSILRSMS